MKQRIKIISEKFNTQGTSLIELVVTLSLIFLFMGSGTVLFTSAIRVYNDTRNLTEAIQVYDILLEKISGEIEGALTASPLNVTETTTLKINNTSVELYDRTGSPIIIKAEDKDGMKQLIIHYKKLELSQQNTIQAIDWTYDKAMYMGYEIESLEFFRDSTHPDNVIGINLSLKKQGQADTFYSAKRYVKCYNFEPEDYAKIN